MSGLKALARKVAAAQGQAAGPGYRKYSNKTYAVGEIKFPSRLEAHRWVVLGEMEKAGDVRKLRRQVRFALCAHPHGDVVCEYVADFVFEERTKEGWTRIVEDAKGMKTDVYTLKAKWFACQYGFAIREYRKPRGAPWRV